MAWTTMHFAVGMASSGMAIAIGCALLRRGWRWLPAGMTLGGLWACLPDMPRVFREDLPGSPFARTLGSNALENWLHNHGDWFFFHAMLDKQPNEFALHGLIGIILFYNLAILLLMRLEHQQRHSIANRWFKAHASRTEQARTQRYEATTARIDQRSTATNPPLRLVPDHSGSRRKRTRHAG